MATFNIGDIAEMVMTYDTPLASVAQNVWHYKMVSGAGADSDDILDAAKVKVDTGWLHIEDDISDEFEAVLLEIRKYDFVNHRFDGVGSLALVGIAGLSTADYEPHGVAALGRIITEAARRQGRTFVPGFDQLAILGGVFVSIVEAAFALYLDDFTQDITPTGGVLSWCTFNVDALSPVYETASLAIGTVIANSLPSYLGKRKPGVGL